MMHRVLVLADDLTGALEAGAKLAAAGAQALVTIKLHVRANKIQEEAVLIIDTETRHAASEQAKRCVFDLSRAAREAGFQYVYKKTDSTLRGNIAAEIDALSGAFPGFPLLYVPAYPKMGRTVRKAILYVDGVPVTETSFARDSLNPVRECHIPRLLSTESTLPVISTTAEELSASPEAGIYVCDGETDSDLEAVARKFVESKSFRLAAGPTGFLDHLAPLLDLPRRIPESLPALRRVLVVNGSRNEVSLRQVQHAREHVCTVRYADELLEAEEQEAWVILDQAIPNCSPVDFARRLAQAVCDILKQEQFDAVVVFGGDTAYAIVQSLGAPDLHPVGEVLEGVPISAIHRNAVGGGGGDLLYLISKAGGFGPVDVLRLMQSKLSRG